MSYLIGWERVRFFNPRLHKIVTAHIIQWWLVVSSATRSDDLFAFPAHSPTCSTSGDRHKMWSLEAATGHWSSSSFASSSTTASSSNSWPASKVNVHIWFREQNFMWCQIVGDLLLFKYSVLLLYLVSHVLSISSITRIRTDTHEMVIWPYRKYFYFNSIPIISIQLLPTTSLSVENCKTCPSWLNGRW